MGILGLWSSRKWPNVRETSRWYHAQWRREPPTEMAVCGDDSAGIPSKKKVRFCWPWNKCLCGVKIAEPSQQGGKGKARRNDQWEDPKERSPLG